MEFIFGTFGSDADIREFEEKVLTWILKGQTPYGGVKVGEHRGDVCSRRILSQALVLDQTSPVVEQKVQMISPYQSSVSLTDWEPHGDPCFVPNHEIVCQAIIRKDRELSRS